MASATYEQALKALLVHEGGKVNHPKDPGGRTNMGITQRVYDGYRRGRGLQTQTVYNISMLEVSWIYREQYAEKVKFNDLPAGVDYVVFDGAVNSGPLQSVKWLQRALGNVKVDGILGFATLAAVKNYPDHDALIEAICKRRMIFLQALKTWKTFGRGWTRRVNEVKAVGQAWATGAVAPEFRPSADTAAKAKLKDAKSVPGKTVADATAGGGVVGATITQATDALAPASGIPAIQQFLTIITVVAAVIAVAAIAYRVWAKQKQKAIDDALDIEDTETNAANDNELEIQASERAA